MDKVSNHQGTEEGLARAQAVAELVAFILENVLPGHDDARQHRDKVRHRVRYGLKVEDTELIAALGATSMWQLDKELAVAWARKKWPLSTFGFARHVPLTLRASAVLGTTLSMSHQPGDPKAYLKTLDETYGVIRNMKEIIDSQAREIERLRPLAERYEHIKAINATSARKKRTRR